MVEETRWHRDDSRTPDEIKILAYLYAKGGEITKEKESIRDQLAGVTGGTPNNVMNSVAVRHLLAEGLMDETRDSRNHIVSMSLGGDWEKYEPAIRLYLGMDENEPNQLQPIVMSERVVEELEVEEITLQQRLRIYQEMLISAEEEVVELKEAVMMLLLRHPGRLVDILKKGIEGIDGNEE